MTWVLILLIAMPDGSAQRVRDGQPHATQTACEAARAAVIIRLALPPNRAICEPEEAPR